MSVIELHKRYSTLFASSQVVRGVWNELEKYVIPYRGRMFSHESGEGSVEWDKYDHYDDTAVIAAQILSASIHGAILPRLQWFEAQWKDRELRDINEAADWLHTSAKHVYDIIDQSNFDLEADEVFLDLVGFGHSFMVAEEADNGRDFTAIPIKEAVFDEDEKGNPRHFFRKLMWTPSKLVSKFGLDNLPKKVQDSYKNASSADERIPVIFAVFPREDKKDADTSKPLAPTERPWGFCYFLENTKEKLGDEGGYYEMPVYSIRWRKVSGSQWGHGPGHIALGDIRQLNQHRLMRTRAIEKAIDPANITTERGLLSNLDLGPRGLTVVRDMESLKPYEGRANFQISTEEIMLMKKSIDQAFRVDQLELKDGPAMTATEAQIRYELMQRLLGPTLGRIKVDWLDKIIMDTFNAELRKGGLPDVPEALDGYDLDIDIVYVGAMATAQKAQQANDMTQYVITMAELQQAYPDLKYMINQDEFGRTLGRLKGVPENVLNGKDEAESQKAAEAAIIANQQKLQEAELEGNAMEAQGKGQQALEEAG